jgi:hypothetical protein
MFRVLLAHHQEKLHECSIRVASPDDGQVMPETCRDFEPQQNDSKSEVCIKLVVFIT